jgi:hypothetical protein
LSGFANFSHRRKAKSLSRAAERVHLVNRWQESPRGSLYFPGTDYLDDIEVGGLRVGHVDYGINPLADRLYINMLEIEPAQRGQPIGLAVLWHLWRTHQIPIVPLDERTSSKPFTKRPLSTAPPALTIIRNTLPLSDRGSRLSSVRTSSVSLL